MCTKEYLTEHPCDKPWLPHSETGECSVLAEDYILQHGPSRIVLSIYATLIPLFAVYVTRNKLQDIWKNSKRRSLQRGIRDKKEQLKQFLYSPSCQLYLFVSYTLCMQV